MENLAQFHKSSEIMTFVINTRTHEYVSVRSCSCEIRFASAHGYSVHSCNLHFTEMTILIEDTILHTVLYEHVIMKSVVATKEVKEEIM